MRGAVSAAMLMAIQDLGLAELFDVYYGASSGSINVLYASAGARWDTTRVYYDYMADSLLKRNPKLLGLKTIDMEYAFDHLMTEVFPLDLERVSKAPHEVKVALSNVDTARVEFVDMRTAGNDFFETLKASSWLPILSGGPYRLNGSRYFDGGVLLPNPLLAAPSDGCTHVVSLNTRPRSRTSSGTVSRKFNGLIVGLWGRQLRRNYVKSRSEWDRVREEIGYGDSALGGSQVIRIAPQSHPVGRLTTDYGDLLKGMKAGYGAVVEAFTGEHPKLHFEVHGA